MKHFFLECIDCKGSLARTDSDRDVKNLTPLWIGYECRGCGTAFRLHVSDEAVFLFHRAPGS